MTEEEIKMEKEACEYIRGNKVLLFKKFANPTLVLPSSKPISLFMAGSPGAGKTEISKGLVGKFEIVPVRIDADEIRELCNGYTGSNSHVFQKAANKGINFLIDYCLSKNFHFILDGTFAYGNAIENIERSLSRGRIVEIWFVYQDPVRAWELTKAREIRELRRVTKDVFIRAFFESKRNVVEVKKRFEEKIQLNLLIRDYDSGTQDLKLNIKHDELDRYIKSSYTKFDLENTLV